LNIFGSDRRLLDKRIAAADKSSCMSSRKLRSNNHLYRLTPAGEDFRSFIELPSIWAQR
jgi:hypothetical protein